MEDASSSKFKMWQDWVEQTHMPYNFPTYDLLCRNNEIECNISDTGIIWFYDWGILWLIAFYDCFPNSRSQVPLSILLFDLILWLGWLDFMTIFHQIWGEKGKFLVLNYSCLRQLQLIMLAMLSKICQTRGNRVILKPPPSPTVTHQHPPCPENGLNGLQDHC